MGMARTEQQGIIPLIPLPKLLQIIFVGRFSTVGDVNIDSGLILRGA
jgi:hypothetical protein